MKKLVLLFAFAASTVLLAGQNLITNDDFQDNLMNIDCKDWYNSCGEELTTYCLETGYCYVAFYNESPSLVPEDMWSIYPLHDWPIIPFVETYVTGQSGTMVYQLSYYMKSDSQNVSSIGHAYLGLGSQSQFIASVSRAEMASTWQQFTMTDTISTAPGDTITVRLSSTDCDFCLNKIYFDLIELTIIDSLIPEITSIPTIEVQMSVYPNPSAEFTTFSIKNPNSAAHNLSLYSMNGQLSHIYEMRSNKISLHNNDLARGSYIYLLQEANSDRIISKGKFIIQ